PCGGLLVAAGVLIPVAARGRRNRGDAPAPPERARREEGAGGGKRDDKGEKRDDGAERYLFVWAGDQARTNPDLLAVVNFDEDSADYGRVVRTRPLPAPGESGNEPHHVGLSRDGNTLACGGLLSVLKGQKEVFFFDVSDPSSPRFITSADPPQSAITDEFYPLDGGGFLVTMMGGAEGHHPGRVAEFDRDLRLAADPRLYLLDTRRGTAAPVLDFSSIAPGGWPQLMRMTRDGKRLFISMNVAGKVVMFDTSNPEKPRVLKVLDLGASSGPHYIALTEDE